MGMTATQRVNAGQHDGARPAFLPPHPNSLYRQRLSTFNCRRWSVGSRAAGCHSAYNRRLVSISCEPTAELGSPPGADRFSSRQFVHPSLALGLNRRSWAIFGLLRKQLNPLHLISCETLQTAFLDWIQECVRKSCDFVPDSECYFESATQDQA